MEVEGDFERTKAVYHVYDEALISSCHFEGRLSRDSSPFLANARIQVRRRFDIVEPLPYRLAFGLVHEVINH